MKASLLTSALSAAMLIAAVEAHDQVRTPRLPDNDRVWLAAGMSHQISSNVTLDIAYTRIVVRDTHIDVSAASGNPWFNGSVTYIGDVAAHVDIFSVGFRWAMPAS